MVNGPVELNGVEARYGRDLTKTGRLIMRMASELRQLRRELGRMESSGEKDRPALGYGDQWLDRCPGLSSRLLNVLLRHKRIETVYELAKHTDKELLQMPGFGTGCLEQVHHLLDEYGLR